MSTEQLESNDTGRSKTLITRRRTIKGATITATLGVMGGAGLWYGAKPALAASVSAWDSDQESVAIETHDGSIDQVLVDPVVNID